MATRFHHAVRARAERRESRGLTPGRPRRLTSRAHAASPLRAAGDTHQLRRRSAGPARHVRLEWEIDLVEKRLAGTATLTVAAAARGADVGQLRRRRARRRGRDVGGRAASFTNDGQSLRVTLDDAPAENAPFEIAVRYACRPRRGLYFIGPTPPTPSARRSAGRRGRTTTRATSGPASISRSRSSPPRSSARRPPARSCCRTATCASGSSCPAGAPPAGTTRSRCRSRHTC